MRSALSITSDSIAVREMTWSLVNQTKQLNVNFLYLGLEEGKDTSECGNDDIRDVRQQRANRTACSSLHSKTFC